MHPENYPQRIAYDKLWKNAVNEVLITDFFEMFLPALHCEIDYSQAISFLEHELKSIISGKTNRHADKLIGVQLKNGTDKWVYVHIEFERSHQPNIKERMYNYHSLIKEKYGHEITALVIYTGRKIPKDPHIYQKETFGTVITYQFNTYEICKQAENDLKANPNPFAIFVLANLYVLQTYEDSRKRLELKEQVYLLARYRNYPLEKIKALLFFIFELILLPIDLETEFQQYISKPQKEKNTMYVTKISYDIADVITKDLYGLTIDDIMAEKEAINKIVSEKEATINKIVSEKEAALLEKEAINMNAIAFLYKEIKMSPESIAEKISIELQEVQKMLKKQGLI